MANFTHSLDVEGHWIRPNGFLDSDVYTGITRPTAAEARRIATKTNWRGLNVLWMNFMLTVYDDEAIDAEEYRVGESFIATSRRSISEVVFKPASLVIEQGKITYHTSVWLGRVARNINETTSRPDRYEELIALL